MSPKKKTISSLRGGKRIFMLTFSPEFISRTVPFCARIEPGSWMKYGIKTARSSLACNVMVCHIPACKESDSEMDSESLSSDSTSFSPKHPLSGVSIIKKTMAKAGINRWRIVTACSLSLLNHMVTKCTVSKRFQLPVLGK